MRAVISRCLSCCALLLALSAIQNAGAVASDELAVGEGVSHGQVLPERALDSNPSLDAGAAVEDAEGGINLQLSSDVPVFVESPESERDLLRLMYRTLRGRDVQIENQLALADMLLQMERDTEQLKNHAQQVEKTPAAVPPAPAAPAKLRGGFDPATLVAAMDVRLLAGLGVLLLLLIVVRSRRGAASSANVSSTSGADRTVEDGGVPTLGAEVSEADLDQETVLSLEVPPDPLQARATDRIPYRWQALLGRPSTIPESRQLNDLAEIILSVEQVPGAGEMLRKFIEANPKLALELWIRLLEMYREQGKQPEFEILSAMLNRNFNVECVPWEAVQPTEHLEMTLQLLPHIRDRVDSTWGHPECLDYLLRLLLNNRNGERHGFSLAETKEILVLIDLIAAESEGQKGAA